MKNFGFLRVAAAVPVVKVASVSHNTKEICRLAEEAAAKDVSVVVFPELSVTGCSCGDLFYQNYLVREAENGVGAIAEFSMGKDIVLIVGAPVPVNGRLYNCAVVIRDGEIMAIVPKTCISGIQRRWFTSGSLWGRGPAVAWHPLSWTPPAVSRQDDLTRFITDSRELFMKIKEWAMRFDMKYPMPRNVVCDFSELYDEDYLKAIH